MSDTMEFKIRPDCKTCLGNGFVAYAEIPGVRPIRTAPCPDCFPMPDTNQPNPPDPETIADIVKWLRKRHGEHLRMQSIIGGSAFGDGRRDECGIIANLLESGDWRKEIEQ